MSSKTTDLLEGKSDPCPPTNNALEKCAQELTNPDAKLVHNEPSPSANRILAGFSVDSKTAIDASIATASSALAVGLAGAGYEAGRMTAEKVAATVMEIPLRVIGHVFGADPKIAYDITRKVLDEPYGPRVLASGLKAGAYGAGIGITAYGLYRSYDYLTSDKP